MIPRNNNIYTVFTRNNEDVNVCAAFATLQSCLDYVKNHPDRCPYIIATIYLDNCLSVNYVDGKLFVS